MTFEEEKIYKEQLRAKNLKIIEEIAELKKDWNGYGAKPFKKEDIKLFKTIINILDNQPAIVPTDRNTLLMQYKFKDGGILAYEVSKNKIDRAYYKNGPVPVIDSELYEFGMIEDKSEEIILFFKERLNRDIYTFLRRDYNYPICHLI